MGVLRDRMIEKMKLRNFSAATQKTYLYAVRRLAKYHGKAPDQLSKEEIRAFLVHDSGADVIAQWFDRLLLGTAVFL